MQVECFSHLPEKYSTWFVLVVIYYIYRYRYVYVVFMTCYDGLFMLFTSLQRFFGLACHAQFFAAPLSLFPRPWSKQFMSTKPWPQACCSRTKHPAMLHSHSAGRHRSGKWSGHQARAGNRNQYKHSINIYKQYKQYKLLFPKSKWRMSTLSPCRLPSVTSSVLPVRYPHNKEKRTRISHHGAESA